MSFCRFMETTCRLFGTIEILILILFILENVVGDRCLDAIWLRWKTFFFIILRDLYQHTISAYGDRSYDRVGYNIVYILFLIHINIFMSKQRLLWLIIWMKQFLNTLSLCVDNLQTSEEMCQNKLSVSVIKKHDKKYICKRLKRSV